MKIIRVALIGLALLLIIAASGCSGSVGTAGSGGGLHKAVPKVVGLSQADASQRIVDAGYDVGAVVRRDAQDTPAGIVITQEPVAGTSLARGKEVNLVIAR